MTSYPSYAIPTSKRSPLIEKQIVHPDIVVHSGIPEVDGLLRGFKASELTFVNGSSDLVAEIPCRLCVHTYRTFQGDTLYIDGGMIADPHTIAHYARRMEVDQREILNHIHITRAFTVYQLSTLIQETLEPLIKQCSPTTILIGMLPSLYLDTEVPYREAQMLLEKDLRKLHELTMAYNLITVCTYQDHTLLSNYRRIRTILYSQVDEIVRLRHIERSLSVRLVKQQKEITVGLVDRGQLRLDDFGMIVSTSESWKL
jgi:hypothetical protein